LFLNEKINEQQHGCKNDAVPETLKFWQEKRLFAGEVKGDITNKAGWSKGLPTL